MRASQIAQIAQIIIAILLTEQRNWSKPKPTELRPSSYLKLGYSRFSFLISVTMHTTIFHRRRKKSIPSLSTTRIYSWMAFAGPRFNRRWRRLPSASISSLKRSEPNAKHCCVQFRISSTKSDSISCLTSSLCCC